MNQREVFANVDHPAHLFEVMMMWCAPNEIVLGHDPRDRLAEAGDAVALLEIRQFLDDPLQVAMPANRRERHALFSGHTLAFSLLGYSSNLEYIVRRID